METFTKVDKNTLKITVTPVVAVTTIDKKYEELESDLKQAKDSLIYIKQRHADEIAPIQITIDLMQARLDQAKALNLTASVV